MPSCVGSEISGYWPIFGSPYCSYNSGLDSILLIIFFPHENDKCIEIFNIVAARCLNHNICWYCDIAAAIYNLVVVFLSYQMVYPLYIFVTLYLVFCFESYIYQAKVIESWIFLYKIMVLFQLLETYFSLCWLLLLCLFFLAVCIFY